MQVILDGNFIHWALKHKIDIEARITAVLQQGPCQFFVTRQEAEEADDDAACSS